MDLFSWSFATKEHKELKAVLQGNGEFTKNLYTILAKEPSNVFFSPISVHAILSLLYQGARGHTQEAFTKILNVPDVRVAALGYKDIMSRLNATNKGTLVIANKIYLHDDYKLQETFSKVAVKQFLSKVELLNFKQPEAAASSINAWVKKKTNNKIKDIINSDDLICGTALVLVNAIYFKGKWAHPFNAKHTETEMFYVNDEDIIDVEMMHMTNEFCYKEDCSLSATILELPYANKNMSLIVVLPNELNGIVELEKKLASTDITKLTDNMYKQEVKVALPKFRIEQTIDLNSSLTELGLGIIFRGDAEFPGIIKRNNICVSKAIQKAFIEVNEEGTEAAAATEFILALPAGLSVPVTPIKRFIADHPFFTFLRYSHGDTTNILFGGRISEPQY